MPPRPPTTCSSALPWRSDDQIVLLDKTGSLMEIFQFFLPPPLLYTPEKDVVNMCGFGGRKYVKKIGREKLASLMTNRFMKWLHDGRGEKLIPHSRSSEKHKKRQIWGRDKSVSYVFNYNTSPLWHLLNSRKKCC